MMHPITNIAFEVALALSLAALAGTAWTNRREILRALKRDHRQP